MRGPGAGARPGATAEGGADGLYLTWTHDWNPIALSARSQNQGTPHREAFS